MNKLIASNTNDTKIPDEPPVKPTKTSSVDGANPSIIQAKKPVMIYGSLQYAHHIRSALSSSMIDIAFLHYAEELSFRSRRETESFYSKTR